MNLSDFQNKDVISMKNGKKIGNIIDCRIDPDSGIILSFLIEPFKGVFSFKSEKQEILFKNISKIGEDVILVDFLN